MKLTDQIRKLKNKLTSETRPEGGDASSGNDTLSAKEKKVSPDDRKTGEESAEKPAESGKPGPNVQWSGDLAKVKEKYSTADKEKIWVFSAGNDGQAFRGNPKYLFVYINRYRPDILAYWMCRSEDTIALIRSLGFDAFHNDSVEAQYLVERTGVMVAEQVKAEIPEGISDGKYLNLWHGVGFKRIERKLFLGDIAKGIARKYIEHGTFYRDHQLLTVTSPAIEKEFMTDLGVDADQLVRTGYLRCQYQQNFDPVISFDHDLRAQKGLPESVRLGVYAPTYRQKLGGTFAEAMKDMEALHRCCERNQLLLIFKVHPNMEKEPGFLHARESFGSYPYFWFWDNQYDFYEIMDQIDVGIIDYSSIISDMVMVGIRHYIRYVFDYEDYMQDGFTHDEYKNRTAGKICRTFPALLSAIDTYKEQDDTEDINRIRDLFWSWSSGKDDFEKTIRTVMDYKIKHRSFPNLYSFDIFDTLISRKVLDPLGIFFCVQEKMQEHGGFPEDLMRDYPSVRHSAEFNVREYYEKSTEERGSDRVEITFDLIFDHLATVYGLDEEQISLLKRWELDAELANVHPLHAQIDIVKGYLARGEQVVLISDMYLPADFIRKMLAAADPILAGLPLFVSSEYGVKKTSQDLFFEVYKSFEPFYDFAKWIHYGDNLKGDQAAPRKLGICTRKIDRVEFGSFEEELVQKLRTPDAFRVAALMARMCHENPFSRDRFVITFVSLCMVPYVDWVLADSVKRGYETLYFISRDGWHLKRIADAIIEAKKLPLRTKYIYASRRTWRIPSFIDEVDRGIWRPYGNFSGLNSKEKLLKALDLNEALFGQIFPAVDLENINWDDKKEMKGLIELFSLSSAYDAYILQKAAQYRPLVERYLLQEIDPGERYAFVEYWGRGYTQDCMVRLWNHARKESGISSEDTAVAYYYSRSVDPSSGNSIRYNFTTNNSKQLFVENIFANMPYQTIEAYEEKDGRVRPVILPQDCDRELYEAMETLLVDFAARYAALDLRMPQATDRMLFEFVLNYQEEHESDPEFVTQMGSLSDSSAMYGRRREFAPPYTMEDLDHFDKKLQGRTDKAVTSSSVMSVLRSEESVRERYCEMYQILPGDPIGSGRLLTEKEQEENRQHREKYYKLCREADRFKESYDAIAAESSIEDRILFAAAKKNLKGTALGRVYDLLKSQEGCELSIIEAGESALSEESVHLLATSRFILIEEPVPLFCRTVFRRETELILLNKNAFPLYNQGLQADFLLKWKVKYRKLAGCNDIDVMQIPSADRKRFFMESYTRNRSTRTDLLGANHTDLYFDPEYAARAREKLGRLFPESRGKKVICYIISARARKRCPSWNSILDMEALSRMLSEDYVIAVNMPKDNKTARFQNTVEIEGFSKIIGGEMGLRELAVASDIIVGDYRDTFFEAALLLKPMFSTAADYETRIKIRNMSMNAGCFESFLFCPVVGSAGELAGHIASIESYDYAPMKEFVRTMLGSCDGHSTKRVAKYLMERRKSDAFVQPDGSGAV